MPYQQYHKKKKAALPVQLLELCLSALHLSKLFYDFLDTQLS